MYVPTSEVIIYLLKDKGELHTFRFFIFLLFKYCEIIIVPILMRIPVNRETKCTN